MVAPLELVGPAVVLALEPDDDVPAGVHTGEPGRVEHHLGARVAEPDQVDRRHGVHDLPGRFRLELVGQGEHRPDLVDRLRHGRGDLGMGMAMDHRTEGKEVVEVLVAIDIPDPGALTAGDDRGSGDPAGPGAARPAVNAPGAKCHNLLNT